MRQWVIKNDQLHDVGEVPYLGVPYHKIKNNKIGTLPDGYDGWFPFMRMCYSIGDLAITSGIFEALKTKYPKIKIATPNMEYVEHIFGKGWTDRWNYSSEVTGGGNVDIIMANNPHIDKIFGVGEFDMVFTDHDRSYTDLIHDGEMIRSCDEPLAEQILRRFGFTDEDFKKINASPKLYFTKEEIESSKEIIQKYIGDEDYGCLLLASRLKEYKNQEWDSERHIFKHLNKYKNKPVFVFSERDLTNTKWKEYFPIQYDFKELGINLRQQLYIKQKALFNAGFQAGITDACSGTTNNIILCPHKSIRENAIRGNTYIYNDGTSKTI